MKEKHGKNKINVQLRADEANLPLIIEKNLNLFLSSDLAQHQLKAWLLVKRGEQQLYQELLKMYIKFQIPWQPNLILCVMQNIK